MILKCLPVVKSCCGCIHDIKAAAGMIAVLAIVTSPVITWAVVRHSYVVRVSCYLSTGAPSRADIVDVQLSNTIRFGFGANAGAVPSCLSFKTENYTAPSTPETSFLMSVKWVGWILLIADLILISYSLGFLYVLFNTSAEGQIQSIALQFIWSCIVSILLSFVYSMLYVAACIQIGGSFPIFEFFFAFFDIMLWFYFLSVVNSLGSTNTSLPINNSTAPARQPVGQQAKQSPVTHEVGCQPADLDPTKKRIISVTPLERRFNCSNN